MTVERPSRLTASAAVTVDDVENVNLSKPLKLLLRLARVMGAVFAPVFGLKVKGCCAICLPPMKPVTVTVQGCGTEAAVSVLTQRRKGLAGGSFGSHVKICDLHMVFRHVVMIRRDSCSLHAT